MLPNKGKCQTCMVHYATNWWNQLNVHSPIQCDLTPWNLHQHLPARQGETMRSWRGLKASSNFNSFDSKSAGLDCIMSVHLFLQVSSCVCTEALYYCVLYLMDAYVASCMYVHTPCEPCIHDHVTQHQFMCRTLSPRKLYLVWVHYAYILYC